ncbi:MAG: hypothetical protein VKP62_09525 [Candidatus Sericytochromatia bacterium]|nr:hypothetical protein [Candidatus Sericytochromatia bacterium]
MAEDPIERARVPEWEVLALQRELNARVRAGTLSGPLLAETGRLDEATRAKQREQEAHDAIALAALDPVVPADAAAREAARQQDEAWLESLRTELTHIPDGPPGQANPKQISLDRLAALAQALARKWAARPDLEDQLARTLGPLPPPGGLLQPDGRFRYAELQACLARLQQAEAHVMEEADASHLQEGAARQLAEYRSGLLAALGAGGAPPRRPPAPRPTPTRATPPVPPAQPPTSEPVEPVEPGFLRDPERERHGRELDILGPERRATMLRDTHRHDPQDPLLPRLVASLIRTHAELVLPEWIAHLDDYGRFALSLEEDRLARVSPSVREACLALAETVAPGEAGQPARAALATAAATAAVRLTPASLPDVLDRFPHAQRERVTLELLGRLDDEVLRQAGKPALHSMARGLQATGSSEQRRQLARLVRLLSAR